jgi:hypothetical protein
MAKVSVLIDKLIQVINANTACEDYGMNYFFWRGNESTTTYKDEEGDEELTDTSEYVCITLRISRLEKYQY